MGRGAFRVGVAVVGLSIGSAAAAYDAPICNDSVPPPTRGAGIQLLDWRDTVCQEHQDRVRRLKRLTEIMAPAERPLFLEYMLPRDRLPPAFRAGMPLLRIVFPEASFFETGQSRIRPQAEIALAVIAASLRKEIPDVAVFIAGHTDDRGGEDYNYNLSVDRANSVAARLNELGVGGVALWRVGFGEAVPLKPNDSPEDMAINRRVEFIIGARTEPVAGWLADQTPHFCSGQFGASAQNCKIPLKRRAFEAVAVSTRTGLDLPPSPPAARRRLAAEAPARPVALASAEPRPKAVQLAPTRRLILELDNHQVRIPAPVR